MVLTALAVAAYAAAAAWLARGLAAAGRRESQLAGALALGAAALHVGVHLQAYRSAGAVDLNFFAALSLVGVALAALTALLSLTRPIAALGVVVHPIAAAMLLLYRFG